MDAPETIAASLTPAQRKALLGAPSTPHGNMWLICAGSTKAALVARRLATGYGSWCTLTDLGKAVREALASVDTHAKRGDAQLGSVSDG
jgi:hypothetical protein